VNKYIAFSLLGLALLISADSSWAARDIQNEINAARQERSRLADVRKSLEAQLGALGKETRQLDDALLKARQDFDAVYLQWQQADVKVEALLVDRKALKEQIEILQARMQTEANAAWRRASRQPSWLDILVGVPVTEVPHRRYMTRELLAQQKQDRETLQAAMVSLQAVEASLIKERDALTQLRDEKKVLQQEAQERLQAKQALAKKIRKDVQLKKKRSQGLIQQEKALVKLLNGLKDALLASDKVVGHVSMRTQKGRLKWPLTGRRVASFGSRPDKNQSRMLGVQIAPASLNKQGKQVRAMGHGQVRYADWFGGFGLMMMVEYGDGVVAIYAHNDALYKQLGEWIDAGDMIAQAGSTGWIENTRLYFEIRDKGKPVNPAHWCGK